MKALAIAALALAVFVALSGCAQTPAQRNEVIMRELSFNPSDITIETGQSVTWINDEQVTHKVVGEGWESGDLQPGQKYTRTFNQAGVYPYQDPDYSQMVGRVTVVAPGTSPGGNQS